MYILGFFPKQNLPSSHLSRKETMKVQQMSTVILSLLIILVTVTNGVQARSLLQAVCSSSCGDIPNISYPFRLKSDPPSCGDPGYELSCENNRTTLYFYSGKYYVKKISYDKHIIRVVDVNLSNGTCNLPTGSLSFDQVNSDFRYRGLVAHTYSKFVRCSENITDDPGYRSVPCESRNGSYVYVNYDSYYSELQNLPVSCEVISMVPGDYINVRNPSYGDILKILESGFDLGWSVECRDCLDSGDSCSITTFDTPVLYVCDHSDTVRTIISLVFSAIWLILLGITLIARYILCPIVLVVFLIYKCRTKRKSLETDDNIQQGL